MAKETISATKRFKKSTARIVRNEINKTSSNWTTPKVLALEILFAIAAGLTISYSYLYVTMQ